MKRAYGFGLGVALATTSAATAAGPGRVSVYPAATAATPAVPAPSSKALDQWGQAPTLANPSVVAVAPKGSAPAARPIDPAVMKPLAETVRPVSATAVAPATPTGITAAAADLPVAPTVPAPGEVKATAVATTEVVETVVPAGTGTGCATCDTGTGHGRVRGGFGNRFVNWLTFKPGPAVLPRFVPTPYQAPLLSYFPSGPVPLPPAPLPGPVVVVSDPAPTPPAPPVATPTPKEPAPAPAPVPNRMLKATPDAAPDAAHITPRGAMPSDAPGTRTRKAAARSAVVLAGAQIPADPAVPSVMPATPPAPPVAPKAAEVPPTAGVLSPVAEPPVGRPPVPEPVLALPAPCSARTPFDTGLLVSQATVFHKCEVYTRPTPCTGHGELNGYRFAMPITTPCRAPGPLMVKNCFGGIAGDGAACGAVGTVVDGPATPAPETPATTPAPETKPGDTVAAVTKPFTRP